MEKEAQARNEASWEQLKVLRAELPKLLKRFSVIADPGNPRKTKHKLSVLLLYGMRRLPILLPKNKFAPKINNGHSWKSP